MARNGSGTYSLPNSPFVTGTVTDATVMNSDLNDIATALTGSIAKDGQTTPTGNLPMGGYQHTGASAATATGQYLTYGQDGTFAGLTTTGNTVLGDATTDTLNVGAGGIVKDASGKVGIGCTPLSKLQVNNGTNVNMSMQASTVVAAGAQLNAYNDAGSSQIPMEFGGTQFVWQSSGAERMRIDAIGNTGFGIAAGASYRVDVNGSVRSLGGETTSGYGVRVLNSTQNGGGYLTANAGSNGGLNIGSDAGPLSFVVNSGTRMAFATNGDITALGVGIARSKASATARASTTTFADDPDLIVPLTAGRWSITGFFPFYEPTSGAGGMKIQAAFSGTSTNGWLSAIGFAGGSFNGGQSVAIGTAVTSVVGITTSSTTVDTLNFNGEITVSVAGNLSIQWAQVASNANATTVPAGAWVSCVKVG